jgi:hypothetical protein
MARSIVRMRRGVEVWKKSLHLREVLIAATDDYNKRKVEAEAKKLGAQILADMEAQDKKAQLAIEPPTPARERGTPGCVMGTPARRARSAGEIIAEVEQRRVSESKTPGRSKGTPARPRNSTEEIERIIAEAERQLGRTPLPARTVKSAEEIIAELEQRRASTPQQARITSPRTVVRIDSAKRRSSRKSSAVEYQ